MKKIRGGSGLGDSLYVRPIAEHYVRGGHPVIVKSNYPDVFIGAGVTVEPFTRLGTNVLAHYSSRRRNNETNQWQDICINACAPHDLPLSFRWEVRNARLVDNLRERAAGRPIVMVHGGREPMERTDRGARELLPRQGAFDCTIAALEDCFKVEVGKGAELYPIKADFDLTNKTTVADLLDIASTCSAVVGQCSWVIPMAEALGKPLLCVWAAAGLKSATEYVRLITPQKILSQPTSRHLFDDWSAEKITEAVREFHSVV